MIDSNNGVFIKTVLLFIFSIIFVSCVTDNSSLKDPSNLPDPANFHETIEQRNQKLSEADFFQRVKKEGLAETINDIVSPPSSQCPDIIQIDVANVEKNKLVDTIVDKAYAEDKSCRAVFTGNRGGYSIVKKSYARSFAYSMVQDLCAPSGHDFISVNFQRPSSGSNDAFSLSMFNQGTTPNDSLNNMVSSYTLTYALGQRESNGNFKEGRDKTAKNTDLKTEESGLTQTSANSLELEARSPLSTYFLKDIFKAFAKDLSKMSQSDRVHSCLVNEADYDSAPKIKELFEGKDSACTKLFNTMDEENYKVTSDISYCFRELHKTCPSFSIKYGAAVARVNRHHNGPLVTHQELINKGLTEKKYAKPYMKPSCRSLFNALASNKEAICSAGAQ